MRNTIVALFSVLTASAFFGGGSALAQTAPSPLPAPEIISVPAVGFEVLGQNTSAAGAVVIDADGVAAAGGFSLSGSTVQATAASTETSEADGAYSAARAANAVVSEFPADLETTIGEGEADASAEQL